jgi:hypothetical protein
MGFLGGFSELFGGGGGSGDSGGIGNSKSTNSTESIDARISGGNASTNSTTVVSGSNNNLTLTDGGAVSKSLELAMAGITQANSNTAATIQNQGRLLTDALGTQAAQQSGFTSALENIKTADVRILIFVGLAVIGLAFVKSRKQGA